MAFCFTMTSGLTSFPVNEFISWDIDVILDPNKYDNHGSGGEKVKNSVNSLNESMGRKMI